MYFIWNLNYNTFIIYIYINTYHLSNKNTYSYRCGNTHVYTHICDNIFQINKYVTNIYIYIYIYIYRI